MYPLAEDYKQPILGFIEQLRNRDISVSVSDLSTQVTGDYDEIMEVITGEIKDTFKTGKVAFVVKVIN